MGEGFMNQWVKDHFELLFMIAFSTFLLLVFFAMGGGV